jgi:hypothetical protein
LFRRCTRVLRSNLRCFFLAILLRRFLMTEPTTPPSLDVQRPAGMPVHARHPSAGHTPTFLRANGLGYRPSRASSARGAATAVRHDRPCGLGHAVSSPRRKNL